MNSKNCNRDVFVHFKENFFWSLCSREMIALLSKKLHFCIFYLLTQKFWWWTILYHLLNLHFHGDLIDNCWHFSSGIKRQYKISLGCVVSIWVSTKPYIIYSDFSFWLFLHFDIQLHYEYQTWNFDSNFGLEKTENQIHVHTPTSVSIALALPKGQLISECLFEKIVWTKIPTKN